MSDSSAQNHPNEITVSEKFGKSMESALLEFNRQSKEKPLNAGGYAAQALEKISSATYASLMQLEARVKKLEDK